jgi:NADH dehydrogenase [ubiquinone] 1 alpha subcomplex assembly factor 1
VIELVFSDAQACEGWRPIDDRIMGGASQSHMRHESAGFAVFEGAVSQEDGGGFASVRHASLTLGTPQTTLYRLQVLGDGKRYKLNLRTDQTFDGVNYQAVFQPPAGQWATVDLWLEAFAPTRRGRVVPAHPLAPERVSQVGLMIADRQWGPFSLCIRSVSCVALSPP